MTGKPDIEASIPWPFRGIDRSMAFGQQPPGTTPDSQNVRSHDPVTDRQRGSSRPGLDRYLAEQLAVASIQDIDSILLAIDQTAGTGDAFTNVNNSAATPDQAVRIYGNTAGAILFPTATVAGVDLTTSNTLGVSDEDDYYYVACNIGTFGGVNIRKIGTDFVLKWSVLLAVDGAVASNISGLSVFENVVYLWVTSAAAGDIANPGIYRFDVADGAQLDAGVWITPAAGLVTAINIATPYNGICAGAGRLGVCGKLSTKLVLQQWRTSDKTLLISNDIQATFESYPNKLIQDAGGNFYVLTNTTGTAANVLKRITQAGVVTWTVTSDNGTARDCAFDLAYFLVGVVGSDIFTDTNKSFKTFIADTGVVYSTAVPGGITTWVAVSAAGDGSWRLRSSAASNDLIKLPFSALTSGTATWTVSTADDSAAYQWVACGKTNVEPSP